MHLKEFTGNTTVSRTMYDAALARFRHAESQLEENSCDELEFTRLQNDYLISKFFLEQCEPAGEPGSYSRRAIQHCSGSVDKFHEDVLEAASGRPDWIIFGMSLGDYRYDIVPIGPDFDISFGMAVTFCFGNEPDSSTLEKQVAGLNWAVAEKRLACLAKPLDIDEEDAPDCQAANCVIEYQGPYAGFVPLSRRVTELGELSRANTVPESIRGSWRDEVERLTALATNYDDVALSWAQRARRRANVYLRELWLDQFWGVSEPGPEYPELLARDFGNIENFRDRVLRLSVTTGLSAVVIGLSFVDFKFHAFPLFPNGLAPFSATPIAAYVKHSRMPIEQQIDLTNWAVIRRRLSDLELPLAILKGYD